MRRVNPLVWDALLAAVLLAITAASVAGEDGLHGLAAWTLITVSCVPLAAAPL